METNTTDLMQGGNATDDDFQEPLRLVKQPIPVGAVQRKSTDHYDKAKEMCTSSMEEPSALQAQRTLKSTAVKEPLALPRSDDVPTRRWKAPTRAAPNIGSRDKKKAKR
jgi:hypothetical protein